MRLHVKILHKNCLTRDVLTYHLQEVNCSLLNLNPPTKSGADSQVNELPNEIFEDVIQSNSGGRYSLVCRSAWSAFLSHAPAIS